MSENRTKRPGRALAWAAGCVALLIGIVLGGGAVAMYWMQGGELPFLPGETATPVPILVIAEATPVPTATPTPRPAPTATPVPTPTPVPLPTDEPVAAAVDVDAVDAAEMGEAREIAFTVERNGAEMSVRLAISVDEFLTPAWFRDNYASMYKLSGTEAAAKLTLRGMAGPVISPDEALTVYFVNDRGEVISGQPLMDLPMGGSYGEKIGAGGEKAFYKRITLGEAQGEIALLLVEYPGGNGPERLYFRLTETFSRLAVGSKGEAVSRLQRRLIALGYLAGEADGDFGEATAEAVKVAQAVFGMQETGIATPEFQERLFE